MVDLGNEQRRLFGRSADSRVATVPQVSKNQFLCVNSPRLKPIGVARVGMSVGKQIVDPTTKDQDCRTIGPESYRTSRPQRPSLWDEISCRVRTIVAANGDKGQRSV